jgi:hypothetical protein
MLAHFVPTMVARWQRAVNLCSAALLAGLGLCQLGQLAT